MSELRKCPFCGGEAVIKGSCAHYWIVCKQCKVETRAVSTHGAAIGIWNKRVGDDLMERMVEDGKT